MKGHLLSDGYLIVLNQGNIEKTIEVSKHFSFSVPNIRGQYDDDLKKRTFGPFVGKVRNKRLGKESSHLEYEITKGEINEVKNAFGLDNISENKYWQLAKAIIAKCGPGEYYLANTISNIWIRDNNLLVMEGIIDKLDVIALSPSENHKYDTYTESLSAQKVIEDIVNKVKVYENHNEYVEGNFSNLPKEF